MWLIKCSFPAISEWVWSWDFFTVCLSVSSSPLLPPPIFSFTSDEAQILFPPTYRFARGRRSLDDYVWVKHKKSGVREREGEEERESDKRWKELYSATYTCISRVDRVFI